MGIDVFRTCAFGNANTRLWWANATAGVWRVCADADIDALQFRWACKRHVVARQKPKGVVSAHLMCQLRLTWAEKYDFFPVQQWLALTCYGLYLILRGTHRIQRPSQCHHL